MSGNVVVEQSSVSVVPGEMATTTIRVRNTGVVVDSFTLTVLGQPAAWTTVVPAALSLFPGSDGTIELHFAPPRTATVGTGPQPFGVRVVGSQDPDNPVVEEGELNLLPFVEVAAKLTPRTSETKRKARHEIIVDNKGNAPVTVALAVSDPDEQLAFDLHDPNVTVEAGQALHVPLKVAARKGFARGADKHRPFQVKVTPTGAPFPTTLDGNLIQKPGMPRFILPAAAALIAVVVIAAVLPALLKKDSKGNLQLASDQAAATTTTAAPTDNTGDDPNAPATAEEQQAAAAAELAANGKDPNAATNNTNTGGGDNTSAAGNGSQTNAGGNTTATTSLTDSTTPGTAPTATTAPVATAPKSSTTTTTTAASTTTTAPPAYAKFVGTWKNTNASTGFEPQTIIRADASNLWVHGYGACSPSYCDWGEASTPLADANDNQINVTINAGGNIVQRITFVNGQLQIHSDRYSGSTLSYSKDEVFTKV